MGSESAGGGNNEMKELSEQEKDILRIIRQLVPYEEIRVIKDQMGREDHYIVVRTQKIILSKEVSKAIPLP